jgi:hypothetical protein
VATAEENRLSFSAANHGQQEKAPTARPGLGWDLTDQTIMGAYFLANSAISEKSVHFLDNDQHFLDNRCGDSVICALGYNDSV